MIGELWREYWVRCGACGEGQHLGVRLRAEVDAALRRYGWVRRRGHRYLCPECWIHAREAAEP